MITFPNNLAHCKDIFCSAYSRITGASRYSFWLLITLSAVIFMASFMLVHSLSAQQTLGWDESVYALEARSWIHGTPAESFYIYRPIGMPFLAVFFGIYSDFDPQSMRTLGTIFAGFFAAAFFLFVSRFTTVLIGFTSTMLFVSSFLFLRNAPLLGNDIAAAGLLLAVLYFLLVHFDKGGRDRSIYIAVILAAIAFYMRYGVILHLVVIFFATASLYLFRAYRGRKLSGQTDDLLGGFYLNPSLKAILLFLLLLSPHFIQSLWLFDRNPLGILQYAGDAANRAYFGEGLVHYLQWTPSALLGPVIGFLILFGGVFSVYRILDRSRFSGLLDRRETLLHFWVLAIAGNTFFFIGLLAHAEQRYILFPAALFLALGVRYLYLISEKVLARAGVIVLVCLMSFGLLAGQQNMVRAQALFVVQEDYRLPFVSAGRAIAAHTGETPCYVWGAEEPQTSWHSGCVSFTYDEAIIFEHFNIYRDNKKYLTVYSENVKVQPDLDYLKAAGAVLVPVQTDDARALVYEIFYAGDGATDRLTTEQQAK